MAPGRATYPSALIIVWSIVTLLLPASAQTTGTECSELYDIDPDNHGTIDLATAKKSGTALIHENNPEFLKVVEERFKAADADNDGTIDCNELGTPAGRSLLRVTTRGGTVRSHTHRPKTSASE